MGLYRLLLHLYPASFRNEYGGEMCAVFAGRLRDTSALARPALWMGVLAEIGWNALAVHGDVLRQDLRYTARALRRTPGFALTAVLVVALGVGANTAAFSLADQVLLRPLPFPDSGRLVKLMEAVPGYSHMELSPANYRDWKAMSHSFSSMGMYTQAAINLVGRGEPLRLNTAMVDKDLLPTLAIQPLIGRLFSPADDREGAPGTALLSYGLWQRRFGGDGNILGRAILLNDERYTVIGVMPRSFSFPGTDTELWTTFRFKPEAFEDRNDNWVYPVGRLRPGVTLAQAQSEMAVVTAQLERQFPKENEKTRANVYLLRDDVSVQSKLLLYALVGAAICVLLIACTNLANLLLVRALVREKELAVRTAIGAGRERLVRQLTTESLVLAAAGGALGLVAAGLTVPLLARLIPTTLPMEQASAFDWRVLLFAAALTALTGIFFGVAPAWRVCRTADLTALREGARAGSGKKERLRSALVMAEVMASVVLLVSTGLLLRALWKLQGVDPGFRTEGVLTLRTALPSPKYDATALRANFYNRVLGDVRQLPGVRSAAYITGIPMVMGGGIWPVEVGEHVVGRTEAHTASMRFVTPGYFAAMQIPLKAGRDVSDNDILTRPYAAVVSESFAQRYWPHQDPLGRHFKMAFQDRTVVGVAGDTRVRGLEGESEPQVYFPYRQVEDGSFQGYTPKDLVVRAEGNAAALLPQIQRIVRAADSEQPVSNARMLADIVEASTASRAVEVRVLGAFAAIAFLLAAIGIHGVLAFAVSSRGREIGVRMALGAGRGDIVRMVLLRGALLAVLGVIPGVALAWYAGRTMEALLDGVKPYDAATFLAAAGLCVTMTLLGCLLPAWRAARVDPMTAMRIE
ncbi:MAG TPA: ABC transporter permease [Bryobacteraceae bacterium]|jgi:putative ABC transport system permease protein|nr:ABC transporter permease [Bryobacteraceae bacterium]